MIAHFTSGPLDGSVREVKVACRRIEIPTFGGDGGFDAIYYAQVADSTEYVYIGVRSRIGQPR